MVIIVKKTVQKIYWFFAALFCVLFLFVMQSFHVVEESDKTNEGYQILTNYQHTVLEDESAPVKVRKEYVWQIEGVEGAYKDFLFYSYHQNVEVYLDDDCIYEMYPDKHNAFGKTPGCLWNDIALDSRDNGKVLRVVLTPVYTSAVDAVPTFYFGAKYDIAMDILAKSLPSLVLGIIAILAGLIFVVFTLYNYRNPEVDKSLLMLGTFSIWVGVWKIMDAEVWELLFHKPIAWTLLTYFALLLMSTPFVLFMKELHSSKESILWYIPCFFNFLIMIVMLALQFTGIADFREALTFIHIGLFFMIFICILMAVREVRSAGWNPKLKLNVTCIGICFAGFALDMVFYYLRHGHSMVILGMLGFIIYIIALGQASMKEAKQLMAIGMSAKRFEHMAYHDQLTSLYNRTAYAAHVGAEDFAPEKYIVVVFDLNDLKKCNDTLGHEKGDVYIRESAQIIKSTFGETGNCYRMGGDEFCVLIPNGSKNQCKKLLEKLREKVERFNQKSTDVFMQIACGYEEYDKRIDYDIGDTFRRADKMMYHEKFSMKHQAGKDAEVR
ncbi:MAG: diguanylate cyclase [Bacteroidales bacterium]|nr:diguanylate cyclase [Lachnoclostridium sp.]MCM1383364.1 diguanylate cyclase [Lachnoclostridium sp.]MCM1465029.1 diguanylate cyclase [Bacteroidales bacterium]